MLITSWLRSVQSRLILNRRRSMRRRPENEDHGRSAERLEDKTLLVAPTLVAVQPNVGEFLAPNEIREVAPQQLTLQFNPGQQIDAATLDAITVTRSVNGVFGDGDDADVLIGHAGLGDLPEDVEIRFAENLPDDRYEIHIEGDDPVAALRNQLGEAINNGSDEVFPFELDLGAQVVSVVPQPYTRRSDGALIQERNEVLVYFNDDDLDPTLAEDPSFYQLIFTNDTTTNLDDVTFNPTDITYSAATDTARLEFEANLHNLPGAGPGTFRLRIGTDEGTPAAPIETIVVGDPGDAFRTADTTIGDIAAVGNTSQLLSAAIEAQSYTLEFPGAEHEPGHREIEAEKHIQLGPDDTDGISTVFYNFQDVYGFRPNGTPLRNLITDPQKERAREVFELISTTAGLDFVETDNQGLTIVTGEPLGVGPNGGTGPNHFWDRDSNLLVLNSATTWDDEVGLSGTQPNWFFEAIAGVSRLLGIGYTGDLPEASPLGDEPLAGNGLIEPDFVNDHEATHLRNRFRPDSIDIDLYQFDVTDAGLFTAEILAERQANASNLDSVLRLFNSAGEVIAQNDDYFSEDSFVELELEPGRYFIGVSASGNDEYSPVIANTGIGGTSQGVYDLKLDFRPNVDDILLDASGTAFDGDRDGVAGGVENFWFRAVHPDNQLVVDKIAPAGGDGRNAAPFNRIDVAFANASPGDIVRIVGNGGSDGDVNTIEDNFAYQIGVDLQATPAPLADGGRMDVPQGVTTMIDAGALLKFHRARIGVGSPTSSVDNSGAAVQVLGIPGTDVVMTSWLDEGVGNDTTPTPTSPSPGNWGGIAFQNDIDNAEARFNYEDEGIFLNYVSHADISYGGGSVTVNSTPQTVNPIYMTQARPTIINNKIRLTGDSAISADPDSFEETNFNTSEHQTGALFTTDYTRVGPDIYGNILTENSTNGLFVRVETAPGSEPNRLTVPARFDDTDIVHVLTGNLEIVGTPGGSVLNATSPSVILVTLTETPSGGSLTAGVYNYRIVFVDAFGNESPASSATRNVTVTGPESIVSLDNLPPAPAGFVGRRLYRSGPTGVGPYDLIADLDISAPTHIDDGTTLVGTLDPAAQVNLARVNARLAIDPGSIVKMDQAVLQLGFGATLISEGDLGREIIFTSRKDDRFGIGGTFDTNNDDNDPVEADPVPGDWGGIYAGHTGNLSIDRTLLTFGGGTTPLEGEFANFNVLEVHQANARITNSVFENNADGSGSVQPNRFGRLPNSAGTIFVRGSQPIIVDNIIRDSAGPAITINANSLNHEFVRDAGRSRGLAEAIETFADNQGPLVRLNVLGRNDINGMEVRGETLTTGGVWDDQDIVHVLQDEIYIPDLHTFGGLRLESSSDASLVVKLSGADAGFTANGRPLDIDDRIGGTLQVVGQPFRPVVLTSLADDSVGAGFGLDGLPLTDTNSDGSLTTPAAGDWRSVRIDQFANDRNVSMVVENETANELSPDTNGGVGIAEFLGSLGEHEKDSDENLRLGFTVNGSISRAEDVDVYSFRATNGTEIWIDVDNTRHALDTVVELLNGNGEVIAQSDNSLDELRGNFSVFTGVGSPNANELAKSVHEGVDYYTTNQRDAGFRVVLPGTVGTPGTFYVRIRSSNIDSLDPAADRSDLQDDGQLGDGLTFGGYEMQIRLRERDEAAGSVVRYSDIRFATNGIEVFGHPSHSPLAGELTESEGNDGIGSADDAGNLGNSDRAALAFSGTIANSADLDWFEFDVVYDATEVGDAAPDLHVPVTIDLDYADGFSRADTIVSIFDEAGRLVYIGRESSVSEDRPAPENGADVDDLTRGTIGPNDPFIGPIELAVGKYHLVVSSNEWIPRTYSQSRAEPISTLRRVADDQFSGEVFNTADAPLTDLFTTVTQPDGTVTLDPSHKEFHLSDVSLYVSGSAMTGGSTGIYMIDGFTGQMQEHVGQFGIAIDDIAMRPDGELFTYANSVFQNPPNDANLGHYAHISTANGAITDLGDEGPTTWSADSCIDGNATQANVGLNYSAIHFEGVNANAGLAVARNAANSGDFPPSFYKENALFNFNITTGTTINQEVLPRLGLAQACDGIHTNLFEIGRIDALGENIITGLAEARNPDGTPSGSTAAFNGTDVFAIDNAGILYAVDYVLGTAQAASPNRNVRTTPITQVIDRPFSGLVAGPKVGTENGAYEQLLFGLTTDGEIYVFDTSGTLQPVLAGGVSMVDTGIPNADGIAFGTLDYNLWDVTANRSSDTGHGPTDAPDGSRVNAAGGTSLYFGNQRSGGDAGNKNNVGPTPPAPIFPWTIQTNEQNNFDFPGGAQGEVVSNEFSLAGYSSEDKPVLYFNYFLETENSEGTNISDSLRIYVGGEETIVDPATGEMTPWSLVATNNITQVAGDGNDERDYGVGPLGTDFPLAQNFPNVTPLTDNANQWQQARIDLSDFAGQDNLRFRFVFASSGTLNIGGAATANAATFPASRGEELYSLPGAKLRDGDQFTVDGITFTFDLGFTLITPSGGSISEGDTFTVDGTIFEFDSDGVTSSGFAVPFTQLMSADEVAQNIETSINQVLPGLLLVTRAGNRVNLSDATTLSQSGSLTIEGTPGTGPNPIAIDSSMTRDEVADQMRQVLAGQLANGVVEAIQGTRDHIILATNTINDPGPLPAGNMLPGDEFGFADSPIAGASTRGTNNKLEGVYIDDIVVGFAERGEMITTAPIDTVFVPNPDSPGTEILTGEYDVEIRRASEFGVSVNDSPSLLMTRSIDTNDRVTNSTSITLPTGGGIADGETFSISDGNNTVIFEFDDVSAGNGVSPGHQPILFDPFNGATGDEEADTADQLARRVRDAINSPAVQGIIDVVAGLSDGSEFGTSSSDIVNLYGNVIVDLEKPVDVYGVQGEINPVQALNSDDLFTFENHSDTGEEISSIRLTLPAGSYFDPVPGSGAPNDSGADGSSGPAVNAASDVVGESFTFGLNASGIRDTVTVSFGNFDSGEIFEFGVDIETSDAPENLIGTQYAITFDSGRTVVGFFQNTQDMNPDAHDDVIDPTRRDFVAVLASRMFLTQFDDFGDSNQFRDQGQILVQQNSVTDSAAFGIVADASTRNPANIPLGGTLPHPGSVRNLSEINTENLVPGVVIENNVVANSGTGGIHFSGDATTGVSGPIPYGRIVNNTVAGLAGTGVGIQIDNNAGPTALNNVVSGLETGILVTPDSEGTTVLGTTLYHNNVTDANTGAIGLGTFAIVAPATDTLFIDEANGNYYPAPQSRIIDSSLNQLGDRVEITQVKGPLGISVSPIIAPAFDVFGQFRDDDDTVNPPAGLGSDIFKDRGAIDRVDFFQPIAVLANPEDNAVNDLDSNLGSVWIDEPQALRQFIVRFDDEGIGVDDLTVTSAAFELYQDDVLLIDGSDYVFTYNSNTKEAIFTAVTTFEFERRYRIEINNTAPIIDGIQGIRDRAGNLLAANQLDGTTQFEVLVTDGVNDPPINVVPADQSLPEDTVFTFTSANGTGISVSDADVRLGNNELEITLTSTNGLMTLGGVANLNFTDGDGVDDATMSFSGDVADLNAALEGLVFTPDAEFVGDATITIRTDDRGQFSGPPSDPETDIDVITLTYIEVNDPPTFDVPVSPPPTVLEDAGLQTVLGFATNMDAGAPNENDQTLTFVLTQLSTTGNISFTAGPAVDAVTGDLTYETSPHTNGTATYQLVLQDDGASGGDNVNVSAPINFTISVTAVNDEPDFELLGSADPPAVDEDAGLQTIPGYITNAVPGPAEATDEATQNVSLSFQLIGTTGNLDFVSLFIDPISGDLTYEAAADTAGSGLVSVTIVDDGLSGPAPNDNEGPTRLFTIVVNPVDDDPVAVTPDYTIDHGDTLELDATGSFDVDIPLGDSITYSWDLDNDGTFGDATGATPSVPWNTLLGFGAEVPDEHVIQLRVTDAPNGSGITRSDIVQATVTVIAVDYGDAPDTFGTEKPDAAAHVILPGFHLGSTVDSDINGQSSGSLSGDDNDGTDDEDGVTFHTTIEADATKSLSSPFTVDVTAPFAAKLDVWVDFNNDGTFDPVTEHANGGISYNVFDGSQTLPMTVPAGATLGTVAARFRLSTAGGLAPTGREDVGEVEDHQVTIIQVQAPVVPVFTEPGSRTIDRTPGFAWTADEANVSYQFQLFAPDGTLLENVENLGTTDFTVATDLPLGTYTYRVRSFNRAGTASAWSPTATLDIAPDVVVVTSPNGRVPDSTPTFVWDAIPGVDSYELRLDNLSTGENNVFNETLTDTFFTATQEVPLGDYRVRVRAIGGGVAGAFSDHRVAVTTPPDITGPDSLTFDDTPTFTWDAPFGAATYQVRVRVAGENTNVVNVTGITDTSYTLTEPLEFGTYRVLVRATADGDSSFWSDLDIKKFTVVLRPQITSPGNVTANASPTVKWTGVNGGETYEIRVHNLTTGVNNVVRVAGIEGLSYKLPKQPVGRYAISVRSVNPFGERSLWSPTKVVKIVTRPVALAPEGSFFNDQPLFTWEPLEGAKDYEIRVHRLLSGNDSAVLNYIRVVVPDGATSYGTPYDTTEGSLSRLPEAGYRWRVRAITRDNVKTKWSNELRFRIGGKPTLKNIGTTSAARPTFEWEEITDATRYILRVRRTSNNQIVFQENQLTGTTFRSADPLDNGEYRAWIRAVSPDGTRSPWSSPIVFRITAANVSDVSEPLQMFVEQSAQPLAITQEASPVVVSSDRFGSTPTVVAAVDPAIEVLSDPMVVDTPIETTPDSESGPSAEELDTVLQPESMDWLSEIMPEAEPTQVELQAAHVLAGLAGGLAGIRSSKQRKKSKNR